MPIIVPPPPEDVIIDVTEELKINRELSRLFILSSPTQIILTPQTSEKLPSGGTRQVAGPPRETQVFRLIPMSHTTDPVRSTSAAAAADAGVQRRYDYTLLGEWNAVMEVGDYWQSQQGQWLVVENMVSYNGYEVRGLVISYGKSPVHG